MRKKKLPRLLASELEILDLLWRQGTVTVLEAQQSLPRNSEYTTVHTRLNRMVKKGFVKRTSNRPSKYSASLEREQVTRSDLEFLLDNVSTGGVLPLVAHILNDRRLGKDEIEELKRIVEEAENKSR